MRSDRHKHRRLADKFWGSILSIGSIGKRCYNKLINTNNNNRSDKSNLLARYYY